jgi:ParB family transcriptional regulator, chromosome partitioning protein
MKSNRNRLGRGLEALIPQVSEEEESGAKESLSSIEVARIKSNPQQPRLDFDDERLGELKQSIAENGIIQPITVREINDGYELISGERRLRAARELGYDSIPAYIMVCESDDHMLELALVENIQRENLNPIELAKAYNQLQTEYGLTQEQVAKKVAKDRATIANFIRLLKLPDIIQDSLSANKLSMGHARAIMGLPSKTDQIKVWKRTVEGGWPVRRVEEEVRKMTENENQEIKSAKPEKNPYYSEVEDKLRSAIGTQVKLHSLKNGGKIEIDYYSDDDLERIIDLIIK